MRINARLDETALKQLDYIHTTTRQNVTEIIRHSLDLYYQQLKNQKSNHLTELLASDFIGCVEGPDDLSSEYKSCLSDTLNDKHDHR